MRRPPSTALKSLTKGLAERQERVRELEAENERLQAQLKDLEVQYVRLMNDSGRLYRDLATETEKERKLGDDLTEALKVVSNAYGCFAGCTATLPGSSPRRHTPGCQQARNALGRWRKARYAD